MAGSPFTWKMLLTPLVFWLIQSADVDWTDQFNLSCARGLFTVVAVMNGIIRFVIHQKISSKFDERRVRMKPSASPLGEPGVAREITVTDHDQEELSKSVRTYCMGVLIVSGIHSYYGWVLPLIFHSIHQPIQTYESPLFQIHLLGESDTGDFNPLKRPWAGSNNNMMEEVWHRANMMDPKKREEAERAREKKKQAKKLLAASRGKGR